MHQAVSGPWEGPSSAQGWVCGVGEHVAAVLRTSVHGQGGVNTGIGKGPGVAQNNWKGVGVAVLACLNLCSYL